VNRIAKYTCTTAYTLPTGATYGVITRTNPATRTLRHARCILAAAPAVFLVLAAACVLILAAHHNHPATPITERPTAATVTTQQVVPCNSYLSHSAMVIAQVDNIGSGFTNSFCVVNGN
jgi:hypothetical protein